VRIPRYWARAEEQTPPDHDDPRRITVWGWSHDSQIEAERHARQRLTELLDRLRQGLGFPTAYAYGERPLREEILDELRDRSGTVAALLTRNSYGSVVLNAAQVLFADVDVPWPTVGQRLAHLFGSPSASPEATTLTRIREVLQNDGNGSYRIYRTAAGFRILATDPLFTPGSPAAEHLMKALNADPAFIQLCRIQQSFRARLTPKPWRCGQPNPPGRFPREAEEEAAFAGWRQAYDRAGDSRASCRFVEGVGWQRTHPDAVRIVELHDQLTNCHTALALA
jgi:hypothetical protein